MSNKQELNKQRQDFLLSFFDKDKYQEKEVNGFWLVKYWDGKLERWWVAIFTKESFERYKQYRGNQSNLL